jgi:hypothetical protein
MPNPPHWSQEQKQNPDLLKMAESNVRNFVHSYVESIAILCLDCDTHCIAGTLAAAVKIWTVV